MRIATGMVKSIIDKWRANVPVGDQQMAANRLLAGLLVLAFNVAVTPKAQLFGMPLLVPGVYMLLGGIAALHMLVWPGPSAGRRIAVLILDCGALSIEMHVGGAGAAWLFAAYLWTISGNGYRFGSQFQIYAMLVATFGFCVMVATTPYWRGQPPLFMAGFISLTAVPTYAVALIKNLSKAQLQAEEANRAKSLFLTSVSHELRTPLNAVIGMGALLESSELDPEQRQMSQTIMTAARSLLSLINGILDMSRIEAGHLAVAQSDFDLAALLNELRTIFSPQGRLKGVRVNVHVTARTPQFLRGDARKLHEILLNLLGNAIKFTEAGSITVAADIVERDGERARIRFEVTDTGIGISPDAHERIFEIFTQADDSVINRFGGTGLGLALVRKSVQLLGGEIGVKSSPGVGSTFWFELPLEVRPFEEQAGRVARLRALVHTEHSEIVASFLGQLTGCGVQIEHIGVPLPGWPIAAHAESCCLLAFAGTGPQGGFTFVDVRKGVDEGLSDTKAQLNYASVLYLPASDADLANVLHHLAIAADSDGGSVEPARLPAVHDRYRVLVADDNSTNRFVINMILTSAGHAVTLVKNGDEALDALAEQNFDLAVLDVNMPLVDGIEVAKIYRMTKMGGAPIPLIAFTADATPMTRERCLDAGMAACLAKPVEPEQLLSLIDEVVLKTRDAKSEAPESPANARVTEIASHPRFRGPSQPAVELEALARLRSLGGDAFLIEVCDLFRGEASTALQELRAAAKDCDATRFRTHAHALRSVAANVGARNLSEVCLPAQNISALDLRKNGATWLDQVEAELVRIDLALTDYCAVRDAAAKQ